MPYKADTTIDLTAHEIQSGYIISSQHRRTGNPNKCKWTVSFDDEVNCFILTIKSNWISGTEAWGLKLANNFLQEVGQNTSSDVLKIAKFLNGAKNTWHGYPADYKLRAQDRPATAILQAWVNNGYITKSKMSKIRLGQACSL